MDNIVVENLCKNYDEFSLKDINFSIPKGEIVGFIGKNGSGKTTTIFSILEIINIDSGRIEILQKEKLDKTEKYKIGAVLDDINFPGILEVKDLNKILLAMFGKYWQEDKYQKYLDKFEIPVNRKISELSKGNKSKLNISIALSHNAEILVLDEPTSGLDPLVRAEILDELLEFMQDENHSILFSTHITSDLEKIADRIIFINNGEIIFEKNMIDLIDSYGILRTDKENLKDIDTEDIIKYKINEYNLDVLIKNRFEAKNKYEDIVIDKPTIEEIMALYLGGDK